MEKALCSFDATSASGPDNIPANLKINLKIFATQLSIPLQIIFQTSYDEGILPTAWKTATVIPIYKQKGEASAPLNHRPVSLASVCCKALEKILKSFLCDHVKINELISRHQHGFLVGRSTQTQLLECVNM